MDSISAELDFLNSKSIVEDFFWTSPEGFKAESLECFDPIEVDANETFDFSANLSLLAGPSPTNYNNVVARLNKDGNEIARSVDDRSMPESYW